VTAPAAAIPWPGNARCAASFSFDVDAESAMLGVDAAHADRMSAISHQAYGPLVGVPRILDILARHEVTATFFVPGYTALRYPDVVRRIAGEGHEIAHHGYLHEPMAGMSPEREAAILDRGSDELERVTGVRPTGYRAPMWELNWHSPGLLPTAGSSTTAH
jgi:peptidoglycan-N-acetylglucosamine deacetylase